VACGVVAIPAVRSEAAAAARRVPDSVVSRSFIMDRADDRGVQATTRVQPASRVTLDWQATPFTCREKVETKWTREKNGRWLLRTSDGHGKVKYWKAPRPRPRLHRRKRRKQKQEAMDAAMEHSTCAPTSLGEAHTAIQVLQGAVRASVAREHEMKRKLQDAEDALETCHEKVRRHATELDRLAPQQTGDELLRRNEAAESGFVGVTRNKGRWSAHTARSGGVREHIGTFDTPVEAARALQDRMVEDETRIEAKDRRDIKEVTVACLMSGGLQDCQYKAKPEEEEDMVFLDRLIFECQAKPFDVQRCCNWIDAARRCAVRQKKPEPEWIPSARRAVQQLHARQATVTWLHRLFLVLVPGLVWLLYQLNSYD